MFANNIIAILWHHCEQKCSNILPMLFRWKVVQQYCDSWFGIKHHFQDTNIIQTENTAVISINQSINHCFNEIWQNAYYDKVCTNKSP